MKPHSSRFQSLALVLLVFLALGSPALCEDQGNRSGVTLMVLADQHIVNHLWPVLIDSLRRESAWESRSTPIDPSPAIVLGDQSMPAPELPERIEIQLLGRCDLPPMWDPHQGPLGWVIQYQGEIQPFIRVDCARLIQYLDPTLRSMPMGERLQTVADAVSRVIVHEWIHISTQKAEHSRNGLMQSQLSIHDLIAPIPAESCQSIPQDEEALKTSSGHTHRKHSALRSTLTSVSGGQF